MTDQGWGSAEGGTDDVDGSADRIPAPNVVPFPGDWIGSLDDLVPIETGRPEPESPRAGAAGFWEGDASAGHEAVAAPGPRSSVRGDLEDRRPGQTRPHRAGPGDPSSDVRRPVRGQRRAAPVPETFRQGRRPRWLLVAALVLATLLGGAAFLLQPGVSTDRGSDAARAGRHQQVVRTETLTTPVTVTTTVPVPRQHGRSGARGHRPKPNAGARSPAIVASSPPTTYKPVVSARSPGRTSEAGPAGCAESPDSGCLP